MFYLIIRITITHLMEDTSYASPLYAEADSSALALNGLLCGLFIGNRKLPFKV